MKLTSSDWLREALLAGEQNAWHLLVSPHPDGVELPVELTDLARASEDAPDRTQLAGLSQSLRRHCVRATRAEDAIAVTAASVLRLYACGHDDPEWSSLIPRWLVAGITPESRGLGLLALALSARDRLPAEDYAAIMDEAVSLLPPTSPLRSAHLYQYALYLGLRGMLQRLAGVIDLPRPTDPEPEVEPHLQAECFYDAICCGRTAQASFLEQRLLATPESAWQLGLFHMHRVFIPVFHAILTRSPLPDSPDVPSLPILDALLSGDHDELAGFDPESMPGDITPLLCFDSLRVSLARRDHDMARRLIDQRMNSSERHWLDDLFLARLLLLENQPSEAGLAFARVEAAALRYGAVERLEIELRLASEVSRHDCCRMGMLASANNRKPMSSGAVPMVTRQAAPAIEEALLFGTSATAAGMRSAVERLALREPRMMLILGPDDGSRLALVSVLQRRMNISGMTKFFSAAALSDAQEREQVRHALTEPGMVCIDDIDDPDRSLQAFLHSLLTPNTGRLVLAGPASLVHVLRPGIYWTLADARIQIAQLSERPSDIADMLVGMLAAQDLMVRCDIPARQFLSGKGLLRGGWSQLAAIARALRGSLSTGLLGVPAIVQAMSQHGEGPPNA